MDSKYLKMLVLTGLLLSSHPSISAGECDRFVAWVHKAKNVYIQNHQVYPVPTAIQQLAVRYMPKISVHPDSWQPISFDQYLALSKLVRRSDNQTLLESPEPKEIAALGYEDQCASYLKAAEIAPVQPAPIYVQAFKDHSPTEAGEDWIYIKYNLVFDWSGLANKISWLAALGATLTGGGRKRWHRLVPFFNEVSYLIDPAKRPWLWAADLVYGRRAGGKEVEFYPVFLEPGHPLADFAGYLAPPDKILGIYTGRDGPPGYNYYAPPNYFDLPDFMAMGYWQPGNQKLLAELTPFLKKLDDTDWNGMLAIFKQQLKKSLSVQ